MDLAAIWTQNTDPLLLARIAAYVVFAKAGIAAFRALLKGEFAWKHLLEFLEDDVLLKGAGLAMLFVLGRMDPHTMPLFQLGAATFAAVEGGKAFGHIFGKK